jgi:chromosome segregation protein
VDAVLSLGADDRRALFEEAAGITLYQAKRAEALARLEETLSNLLRVNDIVNEIAPRLRRLEREAERAERHALLSRQLEGLLRTWYGFRWRQEQLNLQRTRDAMVRREASRTRRRDAVDALEQQVIALRTRQSQLREQLGAWHRESSKLQRQMEEVQRDLAVWKERERLQSSQRDELRSDVAELEAQIRATRKRAAAVEADVAMCESQMGEQESLVAQAQLDLDAHEERRAVLSEQLAEAQGKAFDLATQSADRRNRLAQLYERRATVVQERDEHLVAIAAHDGQVRELDSELSAIAAAEARLDGQQNKRRAEASRLDAELAQAQSRLEELRSSLADAQRVAERLQGRHELLARLRVEGEGLRSGVRAVLQAAGGSLPGVLGTVAQSLHVAPEYEVAIEEALGEHLEDLVVGSWSDAESAIVFLREGERGRAALWPLDTVRGLPRLGVPDSEGVVGLAADLVQCDEHLAPVVECLLGRTLVVVHLGVARRLLGQLQGEFRIVTLAGEVVNSGGMVSGGRGSGQAQGQVLAREREWRELPDQIASARASIGKTEAELARMQALEEGVRLQLTDVAAMQRRAEQSAAELGTKRQSLVQARERLAQQMIWHQGLADQLDEEARGHDQVETSLRSDLAGLATDKEAAGRQVSGLQTQLDQLRGETLYQRLSEARTALAVTRGTWNHLRGTLDGLRESEAQYQEQVEAKRGRIADMDGEQEALAVQRGQRRSRRTVIDNWLAALAGQIEPAEAEMAQLDAEHEQLEKEETRLRARLHQAESRHADALLSLGRQEDRLERLRGQIMEDLGLVEMEPTEGVPEQPPLPFGELVSALPMVERLPAGLEEEIHQLKAQMRRMASVNPNAPDEYSETLDRYTFLTTQAADLEEAASGLREVVAELDGIMRREFHASFKDIAARFRENFKQLFGGGSARLLLTVPDDVSQTGIEIVARPPGKRQQTLALLSGGERALTAVALIFSVLEVSPPPFCFLDEVDAMLDEANVKRFREALVALSQHTQFIIITHNRGTIQAADTIYGVSMGDDSVSQVVSLRMEGNRIAAPEGSVVEARDP